MKHKEQDISRTERSYERDRRYDRKRRNDRSRSRDRSQERTEKRSRNRSRDRTSGRSRGRSRDKSRERTRDQSKERSTRSYEKSRKSKDLTDLSHSKNREITKTGEMENINPNSDKLPKSDGDGGNAKKNIDPITSRTGGAYIPPAKLRMMQAQITDKSSIAYQRLSWEALKKSINGLINKVNVSNIGVIVRELFRENIIRGRGLLARSIMQAQAASPTFTHVYASFIAIINSTFPQVGELILKRLIIQFRRGFHRNNKSQCLSATRFIGHLVNQQVAHEILALEILMLLLESPTDDAVEVAIGFLKECGKKLTELSPRGVHGIFERLRSILHEGNLDKRVQYMIEVMHAIRKDDFKAHPSVIEELDLVNEEEQYTHSIALDDNISGDDILNVFKFDPSYEENEEKYRVLKRTILEEGSSDEENSKSGEGESEEEEEEEEDANKVIVDNTETNLVSLRRTIYLTIQSSLDFEECAHKLLKMELKPGQEVELCHMILDCCAQQRTYEKFYGLLAQRFCQLNKIYVTPFEQIFIDSYDTIHRLETNKLRNVAKFFSHLLYTDAISWMVLAHIKLNEEDTTSSSRIFIKILFQELSEYMGLPRLNERLKDPTLQEAFEGLFPRDNPRNTRFAINFFTSIGLGGLTDELREHLKSQPKPTVLPPPIESSNLAKSKSSFTDESSDESESYESSDDSSSDSDSTTGSEEIEVPVKKHHSKSKKKERKKSGTRMKSPEPVKLSRKTKKSQKKEFDVKDSRKYKDVEDNRHRSHKSHSKTKHQRKR